MAAQFIERSTPGRYSDRERGKHLAKRSLERLRSDYELAEGSKTAASIDQFGYKEILEWLGKKLEGEQA